jgi:hypothetical protein
VGGGLRHTDTTCTTTFLVLQNCTSPIVRTPLIASEFLVAGARPLHWRKIL